MTPNDSATEEVTWRGLPKRAWFRRDTYTYRDPITKEPKKSEPAKWHAGVDIIQTRTPSKERPDDPRLDKVLMHVRAFCGYEYKFEAWTAATHYGAASYRDEIKTEAIRCKNCARELEKAPQDRLVNTWPIPATTTPMLSQSQEDGPWYPSDRI